jgi:hypothetical protein
VQERSNTLIPNPWILREIVKIEEIMKYSKVR